MAKHRAGDRAVWSESSDLPVMVREPEHDMPENEWSCAWRFEEVCDSGCHHPIHAFHPRRRRHIEWFAPNHPGLSPVVEQGTPNQERS